MAIAPMLTTETTYNIQLADGDGGWSWHSQVEYETAQDVHDLAAQMYGGLQPGDYRVIRIERHVDR